MSFALTKKQIRDQTKTVTRRLKWKAIRVGDRIRPVEKCMGLKRGQVQRLVGQCDLIVVAVARESLQEITQADVIAEGFPEMDREDFIAMFCKNMKTRPDVRVTRIAFQYVPRT